MASDQPQDDTHSQNTVTGMLKKVAEEIGEIDEQIEDLKKKLHTLGNRLEKAESGSG